MDSPSTGGKPPLVEVTGLSKAFPGVQALDDVQLTLRAGEVHAIAGENGSGKSTLVKMLYGALRRTRHDPRRRRASSHPESPPGS